MRLFRAIPPPPLCFRSASSLSSDYSDDQPSGTWRLIVCIFNLKVLGQGHHQAQVQQSRVYVLGTVEFPRASRELAHLSGRTFCGPQKRRIERSYVEA
ncbi:hypothetical protein PAXRUDRAFT_725554 [Paxillus rubicundulus Ve08.2h10]|uniref:Uncharacterized protein n=1 Tax=Paxillus rubicundulus Ve08.2h10 TaxID=930991 RepID=A0A0D0DUN5_9AGAM|nr:hypothetical protein PAXRUDRAFT_725554 [Paxillus rubicundulus Ve08.2h10]